MADQGLDKPPFAVVRNRIDAAAVDSVELAEAQYHAYKRVAQAGWEVLLLRETLRHEHMISVAHRRATSSSSRAATVTAAPTGDGWPRRPR
ncbi:MAG TPA: hypothetical protein VHE78_07700, partial [Gemmatimonadaceae bacterium]|nr:hypothetical protein [Gemmatimonadaceae bacterium]